MLVATSSVVILSKKLMSICCEAGLVTFPIITLNSPPAGMAWKLVISIQT